MPVPLFVAGVFEIQSALLTEDSVLRRVMRYGIQITNNYREPSTSYLRYVALL